MCGIAGIAAPSGTAAETVAEMGRILRHRGPDDVGYLGWSPGGDFAVARDPAVAAHRAVAFAFRRLAIIDIGPSGAQPMVSGDGRHAIVFNGEIYNYRELRPELEAAGHRFATASDTEVLLAAWRAWGAAALPRLVGMFAFAVLDRGTGRLALGRDPFGIKPLYYAASARRFAFASEIKALFALPDLTRRADPHSLLAYLREGRTDDGERTLFADIRALPPAHWAELSAGDPASLRVHRYWQPGGAEPVRMSAADAAGRLRDLFVDSVRLHLRSDVPVGAALSGGIDSSAVVMAARHLAGPAQALHTFSYLAAGPLGEARWAEAVAGAAGAVSHTCRIAPDELAADLDTLIRAQDEPFGSTSMYAQFRVFRLAQEAGIKVTLDGQGADELLAGYPFLIAARLAGLLRAGRAVAAARLLRGASATAPASYLAARAASYFVPARLQDLGRRIAGRDPRPDWLDLAWFAGRGAAPEHRHVAAAPDLLRRELVAATARTSLPALLRYADRNSMHHSVESRVPFLTPQLADFALALPADLLIDAQGRTKSAFRDAMRGLVPDAVLDRRDKIAFATPERDWLAALAPWVERVLAGDAARRIPVFVPQALTREWQRVGAGAARFDWRLWRWLNLIRWSELLDVQYA